MALHTILSIALLIRCEWSYEHFCFVYTAECLVLDDIKNKIRTVVNQLTTANFQQRGCRIFYVDLQNQQIEDKSVFQVLRLQQVG